MGCKTVTLSVSYLDLPFVLAESPTHFTTQWWSVSRGDCLFGNQNTFYFVGGVTLLKSALSGLPVYFMSLYWCLISVIKRIQRIQRDFLWQATDENKKYYLVRWDVVCMPWWIRHHISKAMPAKPFRFFNSCISSVYQKNIIIIIKKTLAAVLYASFWNGYHSVVWDFLCLSEC